MLQPYAEAFFMFGVNLQHLTGTVEQRVLGEKMYGAEKISEQPTEPVLRALKFISEYLGELDLPKSQKSLQRVMQAYVASDNEERLRLTASLKESVGDELGFIRFLYVAPDKVDYYESDFPFGENVAKRFHKASYDVEESAKCFALGRSTACVMHLMRVMEVAIDAIALGVGVPASAVKAVTTWEHLLREIKNKIQANNATKIPAWQLSRSFYENAEAYLHSVKDAWRNPSIHDIEKKYTLEEAERIYTAIKHLVAHLAEHLDENGVFSP